jgi:hypothetical protein
VSPLTSHRSSSLLAGVLTAAAAASSTARAEPIDPAFPTVVVVGIPNTPAVGERLDRERTGRSNVAIPAQLSEGLRAQHRRDRSEPPSSTRTGASPSR